MTSSLIFSYQNQRSGLAWLIGRAGVLCAASQKGGTLCLVFPVKFTLAMQKGSMKCLTAYHWTSLFRRDIFWRRRWGTRVSGHRGPGAKGRTLSRDIFRHQSFAFLHGCLIIFKSGLLHATSLGVVRRHSPHSEDFIGTDKKYQTSYSH